ncbi:MarR family winged helix-turn-helix transcriptional regulator [Fusibacter sp. JL298sf-3]
MANYTNEIGRILDRFHTKLLMQDKSGFFKRDLGFKISLMEMLMIKRIGEQEPIRLNELIDSLEVDRNLVTTTCKRLMMLKLLIKRQDETDGRGQCLELTSAGRVVYEKIVREQSKELAFVLGDISINEEKAILKFVSKLVQYHTEKYEVNK